jgi:hypothetical protein
VSFGGIEEVAIIGMARDADLEGVHGHVRADAEAPTRADTLAVRVEARIPDAAVEDGSCDAHWRRLLSPV